MFTTHYLTTSIPYVNAPPHLGFALELVQADALARAGGWGIPVPGDESQTIYVWIDALINCTAYNQAAS